MRLRGGRLVAPKLSCYKPSSTNGGPMARFIVPGSTLLAIALALTGCSSMPGGDGWQTLIDGGKGMENWTNVGGANWRVEDGAIVADKRPDTQPTHYLLTKNSYK